jgi:hypothetical protein
MAHPFKYYMEVYVKKTVHNYYDTKLLIIVTKMKNISKKD